MVKAINKEMALRKDYLEDKKIETVYFGGGTPSLLSQKELARIIEAIRKNYDLNDFAEVTLEANPDDLSFEKLVKLKKSGINRLSIGIQSFREDNLRFMNRAHNAKEARVCVEDARKVGFSNISIDLIYGIPEKFNDRLGKGCKNSYCA